MKASLPIGDDGEEYKVWQRAVPVARASAVGQLPGRVADEHHPEGHGEQEDEEDEGEVEHHEAHGPGRPAGVAGVPGICKKKRRNPKLARARFPGLREEKMKENLREL